MDTAFRKIQKLGGVNSGLHEQVGISSVYLWQCTRGARWPSAQIIEGIEEKTGTYITINDIYRARLDYLRSSVSKQRLAPFVRGGA